jgi:hypothetical protein
MNKRYKIDIAVTLKSPYLVHASEPSVIGLDAVLMRDHNNRFVLPGGLVAGRIRAAWREFAKLSSGVEIPKATSWFGTESTDWFEGSGRLICKDLVIDNLQLQPLYDSTFTRISEDENTGAAKHGALQFIEQVTKAGCPLTFKGTWVTFANQSEIDQLVHWLKKAIVWNTQLGANRNIGFGQLNNVEIKVNNDNLAGNQSSRDLSGENCRLPFSMRTDEAICVSAALMKGNLLQSANVISGGVIKGAIAKKLLATSGERNIADLAASSALARNFDLLRVLHGLPSSGAERSTAIANSIIELDNDFADVLTKTAVLKDKAPKFIHDWKSSAFSRYADFGNNLAPRLGRQTRVRTAIDQDKLIAEDGKLFAWESVFLLNDTDTWRSEFDLSRIPDEDRTSVANLLLDLLHDGLDFVGKSKAHLNCTFEKSVNFDLPKTGPWAVMLNTPTPLFTVDQLDKLGPNRNLLAVLTEAFSDLSRDSIVVKNFFASQTLAGGKFLKERFQQTATTYKPWVLTEAGAVFLLEAMPGKEEIAHAFISKWIAHGLPLPTAVVKVHGNNWDTNPYIPENGYGELILKPSLIKQTLEGKE